MRTPSGCPAPGPGVGMANPLPAPPGDGPYFTLNLHGAHLGADGVTRGDGNGLSLAATPGGLARLLAGAKAVTVSALLHFLGAGQVTLIDSALRVEVEGFSRAWLQVRGFSSSQAQDAIRELAACGWVRTEQSRTDGILGRQVGVLVGSVYGSGDVHLAPPRHRGAAGYPEHLAPQLPLPPPATRPADGPAADGEPVDGRPGDGSGPSSQVSTFDGFPVNRGPASPAAPAAAGEPVSGPTPAPGASAQVATGDGGPVAGAAVLLRKEGTREGRTLQGMLDDGGQLPAAGIRAALTDAALTGLDSRGVEGAVAVLAGLFADVHPERPTALAAFLDLPDPDGADPATDPGAAGRAIAAHALDVLADPAGTVVEIQALARARNVSVAGIPPAELPAAWALAVLTGGASQVGRPGAYLSSAARRPAWKPADPLPRLAEVLAALTRTPLAARTSPATVSRTRGGLRPGASPAAHLPDPDPAVTAQVEALTLAYGDHDELARRDQQRVWRANARIRSHDLARLRAEHPDLAATLPPDAPASGWADNPF